METVSSSSKSQIRNYQRPSSTPRNSTLKSTHRIENRNANRCLYVHIHCSIIHKNQKNENPSIHPSTDKWINQMWYIHSMEYYLAVKKERSIGTCYSKDELSKSYAVGKKLDTKIQLHYTFYLYETSKTSTSIETEIKLVVSRGGEGKNEKCVNWHTSC